MQPIAAADVVAALVEASLGAPVNGAIEIGGPEAIPLDDGDLLASTTPWNHEAIEAALRAALLDELGLKPRVAFAPLRTAISGQRVSPPLFESMDVIGRHGTLTRLKSLRASL